MSNTIIYNDKAVAHPGYFIKEFIDEAGISQKDYAKLLGTTPKNLSILIRGEQRLSVDMALKLARMYGSSVASWLNLQRAYDEMNAEIQSDKELQHEKDIFKLIDYKYFQEYFRLPDLARRVDEQIEHVRHFLSTSTLSLLEEKDLAVNFRSYTKQLSRSNIVNANVMVLIAMNQTIKMDIPKYNKKKFEKAVAYALTLTKNHEDFLPDLQKSFAQAGVALIVLPNLKNSGVNGASKKVGKKVMLMVNDRGHYADTFWFTLFHEIGHILNGDLGISFHDEQEDEADLYAQRTLIPQDEYETFIEQTKSFDESAIRNFADSIDRDPGIVLGRLLKDEKVDYKNTALTKKLRRKYSFAINQEKEEE